MSSVEGSVCSVAFVPSPDAAGLPVSDGSEDAGFGKLAGSGVSVVGVVAASMPAAVMVRGIPPMSAMGVVPSPVPLPGSVIGSVPPTGGNDTVFQALDILCCLIDIYVQLFYIHFLGFNIKLHQRGIVLHDGRTNLH